MFRQTRCDGHMRCETGFSEYAQICPCDYYYSGSKYKPKCVVAYVSATDCGSTFTHFLTRKIKTNYAWNGNPNCTNSTSTKRTRKSLHKCTSIQLRTQTRAHTLTHISYACVRISRRKHKMKIQPVNMTQWSHKQNIIRLYFRCRPSAARVFRIYIFGVLTGVCVCTLWLACGVCTIHHTFGETLRSRFLHSREMLFWYSFFVDGTRTNAHDCWFGGYGERAVAPDWGERRDRNDDTGQVSTHSGCYGMSIMSFHTNLTRY